MAIVDNQSYSASTAEEGSPAKTPMGTAASRYKALTSKRQPYLDRARRLAVLTLPYLFPPEGAPGQDQELAWNSIGGYLVGNLASKVVLAMFPPGRPPMKLSQDRRARIDLEAIEDDEQRAALSGQIEAGLSKVEMEFVEAFEEDGDRAKFAICAAKLIVGGNHAFQFYPSDGSMRGISMERFVLVRDPSGNLLEFVIEDPLAWETLPDDIKDMCRAQGYAVDASQGTQAPVFVYTGGLLKDGMWKVRQECYGFEVPGSAKTYAPKALPFLFLPWMLIEGEDYARSYAEAFEGDLETIDGITQSGTEAAAALARFIEMVSPTGLTSKRTYAQAKNGDVITGRAEDVTIPTGQGKQGDIQGALTISDKAELRMSKAFLAATSVVRDAERVTTSEIRLVAMELEESLGGVYSQQVVTWQLPYVRIKLRYCQAQQRVTPLPEGTVSVKIIGGMAALGRNAELQALDNALGGAVQLLGAETVLHAMTPSGVRNYLRKRFAAAGVDTAGFIPDEAKAAEYDKQQQIQAMIEQLGPQGIAQLGAAGVAQTRADSAENVAAIKATPATAPSTETPQ